MKRLAWIVLLAGPFLISSFAEARTQVVPDSAGEHGRKGRKIDVKSVRVTQAGQNVRFTLRFRQPGKRRSGVTINSKGSRYFVRRDRVLRYSWSDGSTIRTGEVNFRAKPRVHVFSFSLDAIGSPKHFRWMAFGMISHQVDDRVPNRGFKHFRVGKAGPPPPPKRTISFARGKGVFPVDCYGKRKTCRGTVTIQNGYKDLIKPKRYTVAPGKKKALVLRLTKTGKKLLAKRNTFKAQGTLTSAQGAKLKFTAILRKNG